MSFPLWSGALSLSKWGIKGEDFFKINSIHLPPSTFRQSGAEAAPKTNIIYFIRAFVAFLFHQG
ncbi:MAG: hypothetical protein NWQ47_00805, partial [Crocinitomicaceae bacterium]|nr:hypothetical protein [Crocinitomicaceae bacterium]